MKKIGNNAIRAAALLCTALSTALGLACFGAARADNYPVRPVTIVVPFTPGGSTDILARYEAEVLQRQMHGTFVVDNKPGAGGEIGIAYAARAVPDGYTLLHAPSVITLLPFLKKHVSYDLPKDFDPITVVGLTQFGLVVNPALHIDTVAALIALLGAKRDPDMPNVPTVGETVPGYVAQSWQGLFARAGTPKPIVEDIARYLAADLKRPETVAKFKAIGIVAQSDTPEEFRAFIASESTKWGKVIKQAKIEPQ